MRLLSCLIVCISLALLAPSATPMNPPKNFFGNNITPEQMKHAEGQFLVNNQGSAKGEVGTKTVHLPEGLTYIGHAIYEQGNIRCKFCTVTDSVSYEVVRNKEGVITGTRVSAVHMHYNQSWCGWGVQIFASGNCYLDAELIVVFGRAPGPAWPFRHLKDSMVTPQ
jgi:hypothetical protein